MSSKKKILVIAPNTWSHQELTKRSHLYDFVFVEDQFQKEKVSLFDKIRLLIGLNFSKGVNKAVDIATANKVDGILGADDFISCLYASAAARHLGLPGAPTSLELTFQHKYYSRMLQSKLIPEFVPNFGLLDLRSPPEFPFFAKPIRGSASMMAKRIESPKDLTEYQSIPAFRRVMYSRLLKMFGSIAKDAAGLDPVPSKAVYEEVIEGLQCTLEGVVYKGQHRAIGIVDSIMYPHSRISFSRFDFPSKLPQSVQSQMESIASKLISGSGFDFGFYNIEFFYNPKTQKITIIEVNPRMAFQFTDLYEKVIGVNTFDLLLKMTVGEDIDLSSYFKKRSSRFNLASSFVKRVFKDGVVRQAPSPEQIEEVERGPGEARILLQAKTGARLSSDFFQDMESFRLMTVNLGAQNERQLFDRYEQIERQLPFEINFDSKPGHAMDAYEVRSAEVARPGIWSAIFPFVGWRS